MSKRTENIAADMAVTMNEAAAAAAETAKKTGESAVSMKRDKGATSDCVYCGPTVRGVAKQYTVYAGGIPAELEDFIRRHPEAAVLVVPVEKFAQTRKRMETAGTAEAMVYRKIKSEL